jgi:protein phosphatase
MRDEDLKEFVYRVCQSRALDEAHIRIGSLEGLSVVPLIDAACALFAAEPVLLELRGAFVVVGDIHGSIDGLLQILGDHGYPPDRAYLFLGDYVDRGANSIEVLLVLYALKILFPQDIFLLRGNHECRAICDKYGFRKECREFFPTEVPYKRFCKSFTLMPVAAVLNQRTFCVHGGLSPSIQYLADIQAYTAKPLKDVRSSVAEDLLWGDPSNACEGFQPSERGAGFLFDREVTETFLSENGLSLMIRAHQFCESGTHMTFDGCLTVFSACDYNRMGNIGAVVVVDEQGEFEICRMRKRQISTRPYLLQLPMWFLEQRISEDLFFEPLPADGHIWLDV